MVRTVHLGLVAALVLAAQTAPPAAEVMQAARTAAVAEHKNIFLIFHASW